MNRGYSEQASLAGQYTLASTHVDQRNGVGTLQYIVLAQMIGCTLVVFGHSYPYEGVPGGANLARRFIYSFHMPLFVWCSGFLAVVARSATKYSFSDFLRRRAKRLLIPYFAISLIGLAPKVVFAQVLNDPLQLGFREIVVAFLVPRLNIWGHFWFLPMIFLIGLLGYAADKLAHLSNRPRLVLGSMTLVCAALIYLPSATMWFGLSDVQGYLFFFMLGMWMALFRDSLERVPAYLVPVAGAAGVLAFVVGFPASRTVTAVLMILALVAFSIWLSARIRISRDAVYAQTYQIFILSWPFQLVAEIFAEKMLGLDFGVVMALMFICGLLLPMVTIHLVDKFEHRTGTRLLSLILGR